jgi:dTDP-4-amino-4,6-dideoxygalactose transaminase
MGPEVQELEEQLACYVGVKHAITCANGTDALSLALLTLNIKAGDAIFCPTFTFFATAEAVSFAGATPIFVDSNSSTFNMCPLDLEKKILQVINDGALIPKVIITVDLFGLPANYPEIQAIATKYNLKIIEDAAQGFGGEINGKRAGSFGDLATTSFFPAKPLGCYGDGGAVFTNDDDYAELLKSYRVHGKGSDKYDNVRIGMNSRLDTIQAAILLEKLKIFPIELKARNTIAASYSQLLNERFSIPLVPNGYISSWAQYTLVDTCRDDIMASLKAKDIPTMIYYRKCLHHQPAFKGLTGSKDSILNAERLSKEVFSLPMHPYMDKHDISKVVDALFQA